MKRLPFLLILTALAVSLWFNWHARPPAGAPLAAPPPARAPVGSGTGEEMDFSGTGLADDAWNLKPTTDSNTPVIPQTVPAPDAGDPLPPPPGDWDLEEKIKLEPIASPDK